MYKIIVMIIIFLSCSIKNCNIETEYFQICTICKNKTYFEHLKITKDKLYICDKCSDSLNIKSLYIPDYLNR